MFCTVEMRSTESDEALAASDCGKCGAKRGEPCDDMGQKTVRSEMNKREAEGRARARES